MTGNLTYFIFLFLKVDFITIFLFLKIFGQNLKLLKTEKAIF